MPQLAVVRRPAISKPLRGYTPPGVFALPPFIGMMKIKFRNDEAAELLIGKRREEFLRYLHEQSEQCGGVVDKGPCHVAAWLFQEEARGQLGEAWRFRRAMRPWGTPRHGQGRWGQGLGRPRVCAPRRQSRRGLPRRTSARPLI